MKVKLKAHSIPSHDSVGNSILDLISYCARVSNPSNQSNTETSEKLIRYLIKHKHWSPFEMASVCLEITTTRDIARQILRHRSFSFQEFSQRYADSTQLGQINTPELRRQDTKNRQNSTEDLSKEIMIKFQNKITKHFSESISLYEEMLEAGIAKECARFVLPLATPTKIYMTGSCRSWIHYINLRSGHGTQKEHKEIAEDCKSLFCNEFPIVADALDWT